ncbi:DUF445 family protein, partial [uncultured Caulobacter sp.]|uniref:DUF445 family protein n=1 Tax=uncultured Caulobacter sp. TaxID=158749 RepID=UPI00260882C6
IGPVAGQALEASMRDGRHAPLIDGTVRWAARALEANEHLIRAMVHEKAGKIMRWTGLDENLSNAIIDGLQKLLGEVAEDVDHPLRQRAEEALAKLALDLQHDPAMQARVAGVRDEIVGNPAMQRWIDGLWEQGRAALLRAVRDPQAAMAGRLGEALKTLGETLEHDVALRSAINRFLRRATVGAVADYGDGIVRLVSETIRSWDAGTVTARLEVSDQRLRFEISDTGIGIAPDVQARLFQRFTQADSSISRGYGGTGLGLAISKALVTRMGGEIGVISAPGRGSCFWVELPAIPAQPTPALDPAASSPADLRGARVLLVDDHHVNRELGYALLTLGGHEAITAEDGATAVSLLRDQDFDLVLMDVHMPVMDGLAATHAIRAMEGPKARVPILALSADVMPEQIARCLAAGMDGHLAKPIVRDDLLAAVARFTAASPQDGDRVGVAAP